MRIVVFGATGGTGSKVVERALAAGHDVVAIARRPDQVKTTHERLTVLKGDVLDPRSIANAITRADVVISTIGPKDNKNPGTLISQGVKNIVEAQQRIGLQRFVFESGLMVGDGRGLSALGRFAVSLYRKRYAALCADKRVAEATILASGLDWVIVRPPGLHHGPAKGGYKTGTDIRINPARSLSHEDCAEFLVKVATDGTARQILDVGY
jgi:uncharacterized protein YbjT (DUF2867 family)